MDDATRQMAIFLIFATIAIAAAEYFTRRTLNEGSALRWVILAGTWCVLVAMLFFTIQAE